LSRYSDSTAGLNPAAERNDVLVYLAGRRYKIEILHLLYSKTNHEYATLRLEIYGKWLSFIFAVFCDDWLRVLFYG
jgi:hypothetical protein